MSLVQKVKKGHFARKRMAKIKDSFIQFLFKNDFLHRTHIFADMYPYYLLDKNILVKCEITQLYEYGNFDTFYISGTR